MNKNKLFKEKSGTTIKYNDERSGTTNKVKDLKRNALTPGKRISKNGNIYYEKRKNRSDLLNKKI